MRRSAFLLVLLLLGLARAVAPATAASAEALGGADVAAIRGVIGDQIDAFRHDDGERAFGYASPMIKGMFRDPDTFMGMVRGAYQPVYRPQRFEFRDLGEEGGAWVQRVLLIGPDGVPVVARYMMQRQPDGSWLINGCTFEKAPEETA